MGVEWKRVWVITLIVGLCLFGIPIRVPRDKDYASEHERLFHSYIRTFNKSYESNETEFRERFLNFKHSLKVIDELNSDHLFNDSAVYGLTKFSDMSPDEFSNRYLNNGFHNERHQHSKEQNYKNKHDENHHRLNVVKRSLSSNGIRPDKMDWRNKNVVSHVHDQGTCGACWAFSTVETIETMYAIKTGSLQSLSVQETVDCSRNGNRGCEGGDVCHLLEWITVNNISIETESEYPLTRKTDTCKMKKSGVVNVKNFSCESFVGKEDLILSYLAFHGPVIAAVNAINWQNYLGGIIQFHCDGRPEMMNHAVQIVGYNLNSTVPHYIARNSWGSDFGDKGYIYIAIGNNLCGLANEVASLDIL